MSQPQIIPRPTNPFWQQGPDGAIRGGLRNAVPARAFIRTAEDRRSAEEAITQLNRHLVRDLREMEDNGVPEEMLTRIEAMYLERLAEVQAQLAAWDQLKKGEFAQQLPLSELRAGLVRLRIARGLTQRQLARALGVADSTVSRDEQSLYEGLTFKKANRILEALGVTATVTLTLP